MLPRAQYLAALPRKRVAAGAVIRDAAGRVLLVEPVYRTDWLLPGGVVEPDEPPAHAAAREVHEELGLDLPLGRLLVVQWLRREDDPHGVLHFAYDGGVVDAATIAHFTLPDDELRSHRFLPPDEVGTVTNAETAARVEAALSALAGGALVELGR